MPYSCPDHPDRQAVMLMTNLADGDTTSPCGECLQDLVVTMAAAMLEVPPESLLGLASGELQLIDTATLATGGGRPKRSRPKKPTTNGTTTTDGPTSPEPSEEGEPPDSDENENNDQPPTSGLADLLP